MQRFIAGALTWSFAWGMVPAAWALADIAVDASADADVSVESSTDASVTMEAEATAQNSSDSSDTTVQSSGETSVDVDAKEHTTVQLNLGQRIKARCHGLIGPVRVRCVHEIMGNTRAKAESRLELWMERMRARMTEHQEKFEERMNDREEKAEKKVEQMHRKGVKLSSEVRAQIRTEHKLQVESARTTCHAKPTFQEERACMAAARIELRAKLKAMIDAAMNQDE